MRLRQRATHSTERARDSQDRTGRTASEESPSPMRRLRKAMLIHTGMRAVCVRVAALSSCFTPVHVRRLRKSYTASAQKVHGKELEHPSPKQVFLGARARHADADENTLAQRLTCQRAIRTAYVRAQQTGQFRNSTDDVCSVSLWAPGTQDWPAQQCTACPIAMGLCSAGQTSSSTRARTPSKM
jgi:hypothetical protein